LQRGCAFVVAFQKDQVAQTAEDIAQIPLIPQVAEEFETLAEHRGGALVIPQIQGDKPEVGQASGQPGPVVRGAGQRDAFLEELHRPLRHAQLVGDDTQVRKGAHLAAAVASLPPEIEGGFVVQRGGGQISLRFGQGPGAVASVAVDRRVGDVCGVGEGVLQPRSSFTEIAALPPEPPERRGQSQLGSG
jgi:hypothetical protein